MSPKVTIEHSAQIRVLHQISKVKGKRLLGMFPQYKPATIYKHAKKPINGEPVFDKRTDNKGRPRKISIHDGRQIVRQVHRLRVTERTFCSPRVQHEAGMNHVSNRTVRRSLNRKKYGYLRTRRKGMLKLKDLPKRRKWCRAMKMLSGSSKRYWTDNVSFYCDGVGFEYKTNPQETARAPAAREWRRPDEGLSLNCTAKGSKEGVRQNHFMVGIAHNRGVVLCEQYEGHMTGAKFAGIVKKSFPAALKKCKNPRARYVLMDGCPCQGSKASQLAYQQIKAKFVVVPARSPDLNPIENFFHLTKKKLRVEAIEKQISKETFEEFSARCKAHLLNYPTKDIDAMIESMPKRVNLVLFYRGQRIKY